MKRCLLCRAHPRWYAHGWCHWCIKAYDRARLRMARINDVWTNLDNIYFGARRARYGMKQTVRRGSR